ncbi:MAG: hypothetical protein P8K08_24190 [Fuerstiella sp.]|nr:hypothetical protein [Fuerstiella sp.]
MPSESQHTWGISRRQLFSTTAGTAAAAVSINTIKNNLIKESGQADVPPQDVADQGQPGNSGRKSIQEDCDEIVAHPEQIEAITAKFPADIWYSGTPLRADPAL